MPHVLAALAHAGMELAEGKDVMRNVKTVVGPAWIKEVAGTEVSKLSKKKKIEST